MANEKHYCKYCHRELLKFDFIIGFCGMCDNPINPKENPYDVEYEGVATMTPENGKDDVIAEVSEGMERLSEYIGKCLERPSEEDEKNDN